MQTYITERLPKIKGAGTIIATVPNGTDTTNKTLKDIADDILAFGWFPQGADIKPLPSDFYPNTKEIRYVR